MPTNNPRSNVVSLAEGGSFSVKDHRGFTIVEFNENGDIRFKGKMVKLV